MTKLIPPPLLGPPFESIYTYRYPKEKGETGLILLINVQNKRRGIIKVGKLSKSLIYERLQKARGLIIHTPIPTTEYNIQ